MSLLSLILALAKAAPAFDRLLAQLAAAYSAARIQANHTDEAAKNARNAAAVAAAGGPGVQLCAACPFAGQGAGSHGAAPLAPAVSGGGTGSA